MDRSEIDALKADLRRMQARIDELERTDEEPVNRRNMLRGLGAAAAGAAVGGLAFARPAAANDGDTLIIGNDTQVANTPTTLLASNSPSTWDSSDPNLRAIFNVTNRSTFSNVNAALSCIAAYADSTGPGAHNIGVWSSSANGIGAKLDGPTPLKLTDNSGAGAPNQSSGTIGHFRINGGDLWFCVDDDSTHNWRKLAGVGVAGGFHALTPFRAYDSRAAQPSQGIISTGQNRTISVKDSRDGSGAVISSNVIPSGAAAVAANIAVLNTTVGPNPGNGGNLTVNPGGITTANASAINWFGNGQILANGLTLALNTSRQVTVVCGGAAGASTNFLIDIYGYYI